MDDTPFWITLKLASVTTALLLLISLPLSAWLSRPGNWLKTVVEAVVSMPLILPPTVLGFYFLEAMGPTHLLGRVFERIFDVRLVFSFPGLVVASVVYSLPFMVHPIRAGMAALPRALADASYTLGKSPWHTFFKVTLPNIRQAVITGVVLAFAHTVGEFGVVLMIGGNIPGQTKVVSVAIFDEVEAMNYRSANRYAAVLLAITFLMLLIVFIFNRNMTTSRRL